VAAGDASLTATWQVVEILRPDGESYRESAFVRGHVSVVAARRPPRKRQQGAMAAARAMRASSKPRRAGCRRRRDREALVNLESVRHLPVNDVVLGAGWPGVMRMKPRPRARGDFNRKSGPRRLPA